MVTIRRILHNAIVFFGIAGGISAVLWLAWRTTFVLYHTLVYLSLLGVALVLLQLFRNSPRLDQPLMSGRVRNVIVLVLFVVAAVFAWRLMRLE